MESPDEYTSAAAIFHPIKRFLTENEASRGSRLSNAVSARVVQNRKRGGFFAAFFATLGSKNLPAATWEDAARWRAAHADPSLRKQWKHLVRRGIPAPVRLDVWREMIPIEVDDTAAAHFERPFTAILTKQFGAADDAALYKYPTFGADASVFAAAGSTAGTLQRICFVLGVVHPQVNYAPLLPPLAALLLDARYTPDEICRLLALLVAAQQQQQHYLPLQRSSTRTSTKQSRRASAHDFPRTLSSASSNATASSALAGPNDDPPFTHVPLSAIGAYTFSRTLYLLVQESFPLLSGHLDAVFAAAGRELPYFALVDTFFASFPMETRLRILDALLSEGYKIVYRYVLAVLHVQRKALLASASADEIAEAVLRPPVHQLPKLAFSAVHLSRAHVQSRTSSPAQTPRGSPQRSVTVVARAASGFTSIPHHPSRSLFAAPYCHLRPHLSGGASAVLRDAHWQELWRGGVPPSHASAHAQKVFDAHADGYRLRTLLERAAECDRRAPLLLLVETREGAVLGAWLDGGLDQSHPGRFGGSEETFVFRLTPKLVKHVWVGKTAGGASSGPAAAPTRDDSLFVMVGAHGSELAVGGGGLGFALRLDGELQGSSAPSATFGTAGNLVDERPALALFHTASVELWAMHAHG